MHAPSTEIEGVVSTEDTRYSLNFVHLRQGEDGPELAATDGRMLARIPATMADEELVPKDGAFIPAAAIKAARKNKLPLVDAITLEEGKVRVKVSKKGGVVEQTFPVIEGGKFPDLNIKEFARPPKGAKPTIVLDAERLYALARAICEKQKHAPLGIELYIDPKNPDAGMRVMPQGRPEGTGYGILMPMTRV